jgi:RNA polymerase sigma factor (sigma-70 family)
MLRAAYRITGSAADAEDALQTVVLRLLRRGQALLEDEPAYLRRAAVNAALDLVRARGPLTGLSGSELPAPSADSADPRLAAALRGALARLPRRTAEIFALRHFEDLDNREIAGLLGMTQVHVAVALHRARRRLQPELAVTCP